MVSTEWLADHLRDPETVVLHVARDRAGYDRAHIAGAHFLPFGAIVAEQGGVPNELPPVAQLDSVFESVGVGDRSRVILYGEMNGLAAARAFFTLDYLGHARTSVLDGGLETWRAEGRPVTAEVPPATRATLNPRPHPELVVYADWVKAHLDSAGVVLLDARPPAQYTGRVPGEGITRPGHIRGARNLFWETTLLSPERPLLRTTNVLRGLFRLAGVEPRDTVVTYCRTGVQASWLYLVSRYLGYPTRMYDASYLDWSRRGAGFPVATGAAPGDSASAAAARRDSLP